MLIYIYWQIARNVLHNNNFGRETSLPFSVLDPVFYTQNQTTLWFLFVLIISFRAFIVFRMPLVSFDLHSVYNNKNNKNNCRST